MSAPLTVTVSPTPDGVSTEIFCPAFVDYAEHGSAQEALDWVSERLGGDDPFAEYDPFEEAAG